MKSDVMRNKKVSKLRETALDLDAGVDIYYSPIKHLWEIVRPSASEGTAFGP